MAKKRKQKTDTPDMAKTKPTKNQQRGKRRLPSDEKGKQRENAVKKIKVEQLADASAGS
jgi:hypothetical protein